VAAKAPAAIRLKIEMVGRDHRAREIANVGLSFHPMWKRRLVLRWTKGVSSRAGDGAESYSKKYERYWRIIKLTVERNRVDKIGNLA
jgi:hypothetical protein